MSGDGPRRGGDSIRLAKILAEAQSDLGPGEDPFYYDVRGRGRLLTREEREERRERARAYFANRDHRKVVESAPTASASLPEPQIALKAAQIESPALPPSPEDTIPVAVRILPSPWPLWGKLGLGLAVLIILAAVFMRVRRDRSEDAPPTVIKPPTPSITASAQLAVPSAAQRSPDGEFPPEPIVTSLPSDIRVKKTAPPRTNLQTQKHEERPISPASTKSPRQVDSMIDPSRPTPVTGAHPEEESPVTRPEPETKSPLPAASARF